MCTEYSIEDYSDRNEKDLAVVPSRVPHEILLQLFKIYFRILCHTNEKSCYKYCMYISYDMLRVHNTVDKLFLGVASWFVVFKWAKSLLPLGLHLQIMRLWLRLMSAENCTILPQWGCTVRTMDNLFSLTNNPALQ